MRPAKGSEDGEPGQYRVNQAIFESAFLWRGFSWAQELHWKANDDRKNTRNTTLAGLYAQVSCSPGEAMDWGVPDPLEVAVGYGVYDPDLGARDNRHDELSIAVNWFFSGHDSKLAEGFSWLTLEDEVSGQEERGRCRLRWDVQF